MIVLRRIIIAGITNGFSKQKESIYCVLQFDNYTDYLDSNHLLELIHERITYFLLLVNIR